MTPSSPFWSAIDAIVVINLDHRSDRWAMMQAHLAPIAPMSKVHRLSAVRGVDLPGYGDKRWFGRTRRPTTWAGRAGCTLSHRNALRLMRDKGWKRMLILEDDARVVRSMDAQWDALGGLLGQAGAPPRVCYLGFGSPRGPVERLADFGPAGALCRIGGCLGTYAYTVDREAAELLLPQFPAQDQEVWPWLARHTAIDTWYSHHLARSVEVCAISTRWIGHEETASDIVVHQSGAVGVSAGSGADVLSPLPGASLRRRAADILGAAGRRMKWGLRCVRGL